MLFRDAGRAAASADKAQAKSDEAKAKLDEATRLAGDANDPAKVKEAQDAAQKAGEAVNDDAVLPVEVFGGDARGSVFEVLRRGVDVREERHERVERI